MRWQIKLGRKYNARQPKTAGVILVSHFSCTLSKFKIYWNVNFRYRTWKLVNKRHIILVCGGKVDLFKFVTILFKPTGQSRVWDRPVGSFQQRGEQATGRRAHRATYGESLVSRGGYPQWRYGEWSPRKFLRIYDSLDARRALRNMKCHNLNFGGKTWNKYVMN